VCTIVTSTDHAIEELIEGLHLCQEWSWCTVFTVQKVTFTNHNNINTAFEYSSYIHILDSPLIASVQCWHKDCYRLFGNVKAGDILALGSPRELSSKQVLLLLLKECTLIQ
jgi:hypothetical protein